MFKIIKNVKTVFSKIKFNSEFLIFSQKTLLRSFQTLWNCESVYSIFKTNKNNQSNKKKTRLGILSYLKFVAFECGCHVVAMGRPDALLTNLHGVSEPFNVLKSSAQAMKMLLLGSPYSFCRPTVCRFDHALLVVRS